VKQTHIRNFVFVVLILTFGPLAFGQVCVTSAPGGICGPYYYPLVTGSDGTNVNIQNGFWNEAAAANANPTETVAQMQTMYATDPGNWYVIDNFATGETEIWTYPNSDALYFSAPPRVSSFSYLYSSFGEDMNKNPNTDAEAAYDIWLNGYNNEVMIWNDISNRGGPNYYGGCTSKLSAQVVFGGSDGVPKHLWNLAKCGSELIWQLDQPALTLCGATSNRPNDQRGGPVFPHESKSVFPHESIDVGTGSVYGITRGSVDVLAMLTWLMNNGYLPTDSTLTQLEYGFEIASTGGVNEKFQVTRWSVTEQPGLPH
jgi:hypothetical protein